jgi:two-component system response regulator AtoC
MQDQLRCILVIAAQPNLGILRAANFKDPTTKVIECSLDSVNSAVEQCAPQCILVEVSKASVIARTVVERLRCAGFSLPIVAVVSAGSVAHAVAAMRAGVNWVVEGPLSAKTLFDLKEWWCEYGQPRLNKQSSDSEFGRLVGSSGVMRSVYSQIESVAPRDTTVLITGESGTGKELVAREIHNRSSRCSGPFVAINCGAIPDELVESEFFGHERGSFTSASERRIGSVELADGGTLFLDEVSELSQRAQVKLLRFLQDRQVKRIGNSKLINVDTRIIAASNGNLEELVRCGRFRHDLLYRINVIQLAIPALRERKDDIDLLFRSCIQKLSPRYGGRCLQLSADSRQVLANYSWPGNVRELENLVEALLALHPFDQVQAKDLPQKILKAISANSDRIKLELNTNYTEAFGEANRLLETELIISALERSQYVQSKAARLLGISRRILKYKMDKLGIVNERCRHTGSDTVSRAYSSR